MSSPIPSTSTGRHAWWRNLSWRNCPHHLIKSQHLSRHQNAARWTNLHQTASSYCNELRWKTCFWPMSKYKSLELTSTMPKNLPSRTPMAGLSHITTLSIHRSLKPIQTEINRNNPRRTATLHGQALQPGPKSNTKSSIEVRMSAYHVAKSLVQLAAQRLYTTPDKTPFREFVQGSDNVYQSEHWTTSR